MLRRYYTYSYGANLLVDGNDFPKREKGCPPGKRHMRLLRTFHVRLNDEYSTYM